MPDAGIINLRGTYRPGQDRLVYTATGKDAAVVVARIYEPNHGGSCWRIILDKLEKNVFVLDFTFRDLGNYIFIFDEDGTVTTILNAKVYV